MGAMHVATISSTGELLQELVALYPPEYQEPVRAEIPALVRSLDRLALEIAEVEARGIAYAEAVRNDAMGYPLMARIHHGVIPLIQSELPADVRDAIRAMLPRLRTSPHIGEFARAAFNEAASSTLTKEAAVLRFFIYQALRLSLALACWQSPEVEATGTEIAFEWRAQEILNEWLDNPEAQADDVQPLRGMLAEALLWIKPRMDATLASLSPDLYREVIEILIPAAELARTLNARDAVILRNSYASRLGDRPLESQEIVDRHPTLFRTRAAVDTRRHRLVKRAETSEITTRQRGGRLIDELSILDEESEG